MRLLSDLGHNPMVTMGGVKRAFGRIEDGVTLVVFPGLSVARTVDAEKWRTAIATAGAAALTNWGGLDRLKACGG